MSIARAISAQVARSSRSVRLNSDLSLIYDFCRGIRHPWNKPSLKSMQSRVDTTRIRFHRALAKDVSAVFKAYEREEDAEADRREAFEKLRKLIHAMGSNGEYELVDISLDSLPNIPRFYHSPLECAIIDRTQQAGFSLSPGTAVSPAAYDALTLSGYLTENGYNGTFIDSRPDVGGSPIGHSDSRTIPPEPTWGQLTTPMSSILNVLPPVLRIKPDNAGHPEILLRPAHASNEFRWNLIKHACNSSEALRVLVSTFWLWMRSHGVEHYSWTTCVFLVMFYLQDRSRPPSATDDGHDVHPPSQDIQDWHSSLFLPHIPNPDTHPGALIFDFFSYWAGNKYLPNSRILDPLTGSHVPRKNRYMANTGSRDVAQVMKELQNKSGKGVNDVYWEYQPLVLVDPFLSSHNLAHRVTKYALQRMLNRSQVCAQVLKKGLPLTEIFGPELPPPVPALVDDQGKEGLVGLRDTILLSQSPNSPGGSQIQRMYHTSARGKGKVLVLPGIRPPSEVPRRVLAARERTINQVRRIVKERYGEQYLVECFGSTQYGVDSPTSDLDLVVLDQDRKTGFTPDVTLEYLPVIYNVRNLAKTLERNGFWATRVIAHATVPIVKFEDPHTRLSCDININDRLGLFNTRLIATYCSLSPLLRPLLMLLKQWAKTLGLNDPSGEGGTTTFSSYALTLMTVGFLQAHELLPNLQAGLPPLKPEEAFWICGKDNQRTRCDPRFNTSPTWTAESNIQISDLRGALVTWFRFWGHQFNYAHDILSIRDGGVVPREEAGRATVTAEKQAQVRALRMEKKAKKEAKEAEKARKRAEAEELARLAKLRKEKKVREGMEGAKEGKEGVVDGEGEAGEGPAQGGAKSAPAVESEAVPQPEPEPEPGVTAEETVEDEDADADELDGIDEAAAEVMDQADLKHGRQPRSWARTTFVVADPFIVAKNVTGQVIPYAISHFTAECRRSLLLLSSGADFEDLLGDGSALGRSGRRGTRIGKKARGKVKAVAAVIGVREREQARVERRERMSRERSLERQERRSLERQERSLERRERSLEKRERSVEKRERSTERTEGTAERTERRAGNEEERSASASRKRDSSKGRKGKEKGESSKDSTGGGSRSGGKNGGWSGNGRKGKGKGKEIGRWTKRAMDVRQQAQAQASSSGGGSGGDARPQLSA